MEGRVQAERTRKVNPEAAAAELAAHYARILGRHADRQVSDVVRICLRSLPSRLPIHGEDLRAVEVLIERVLRLGEVGARDPFGSPRQIDDYIARQLGLPVCGPRFVYRALRSMLGRTALVERHSRQLWSLHLAGLTDSSSPIHRALLTETPTPYSLSAPEKAGADESGEPHRPPQADTELRRELAHLQEMIAVEHAARIVAEGQHAEANNELERTRRALDAVRSTAARVGELERELSVLRKSLEDERGARVKEMVNNAGQRYALEHEYLPIRQALDEERQARGEAERRIQTATAQLIEIKEKHLAALREHGAELQSMQAEIVRLVRDAQIADATHVWQLIEAGRSREALAFLATRMKGLDVDVTEGATSAGAEGPAAANAPSPPSRAATSRGPAKMPWSPTVHAPAAVDLDQNQQGAHGKANKVGRNEPCPCGSGLKSKRCCGRLG